ncbi:MAG: transposase [Desulfomonile tiedjei]|nr:transposase [Desulfomonile tiedjei]
MNTPELTIYRRKLPHWRIQGAIYFVTWRLAKHQLVLTPEERTDVETSLKYFEGQRYELPAYVVMDDHTHVLVVPLEGFGLQKIVHSWKTFSARRLTKNWGRTSPVWQHEYFDRIVRDEKELIEKAQYILNNPLKRWPSIQEYPWVGFGSCL